MTIVFQRDSANIAVKTIGDTPACRVVPSEVTAHFDSCDQTQSKPAIFMEATVKATKAQTDSTGNWDIGFIQVFSEPVNIYHFAGLHDTDGSVILDFSDDAYLLDSEKYWFGFTNDSASTSRPDPQQAQGQAMGIIVGATMNDNPTDKMSLDWQNYRTNKRNFLIRAQRQFDITTAFVVRERANTGAPFDILGHFAWHGFWEFAFTWSRKNPTTPTVSDEQSDFWADAFVKGPPQDAKIAKQIARASRDDEMYNPNARAQLNAVRLADADNDWMKAFRRWNPKISAAARFAP
jgi:hypothetical protein